MVSEPGRDGNGAQVWAGVEESDDSLVLSRQPLELPRRSSVERDLGEKVELARVLSERRVRLRPCDERLDTLPALPGGSSVDLFAVDVPRRVGPKRLNRGDADVTADSRQGEQVLSVRCDV